MFVDPGQAHEPSWQLHTAGCDSSECSLCHWQHLAASRTQQKSGQPDTVATAHAATKAEAASVIDAASASQHSSQLSSYTCADTSGSASQPMTRLDDDSCCGDALEGAVPRHLKRQRLNSGKAGAQPCSSAEDLVTAGRQSQFDMQELPSSQSGAMAGDDALVPSDSARLARAAGSYSQLATLDSWVPSPHALTGRRNSSSAVLQHADMPWQGGGTGGAGIAGGRSDAGDVSAHILPQIVVPSQPQPVLQQPDATVPLRQQRQQAPLTKQAFVDSLSTFAAADEGSRSAEPAQQTTLTEVAAFQRPHLPQQRQQHMDIVCGVEFSGDGWHLATAGIRKQIRLYSLASGLGGDGPVAAVSAHRMPAKLSSLAWCPDGAPGVVTVGDYDGDVSQIDLTTGHHVADVDGHGGRRVWSVAHSHLRRTLCASASDDGTAALWGGHGLSTRAAAPLAPAPGCPVTCVDFCREDENALLVACADGAAYIYDLRNTTTPCQTLKWHDGAVSYARFCGREAATAATDGTIAYWDLAIAAAGGILTKPIQVMAGHTNRRNFVGLSVLHGGVGAAGCGFGSGFGRGHVLACGSEDAVVHTYHTARAAPLATWRLMPAGATAHSGCAASGPVAAFSGGKDEAVVPVRPATGSAALSRGGDDLSPGSTAVGSAVARREFVSSVAWAPPSATASDSPLLAVAASDGELRVLSLQAAALP